MQRRISSMFPDTARTASPLASSARVSFRRPPEPEALVGWFDDCLAAVLDAGLSPSRPWLVSAEPPAESLDVVLNCRRNLRRNTSSNLCMRHIGIAALRQSF